MAADSPTDMKKCLLWVLLLNAGFSLFAQANPNASVYIPPITGFGKDQSDNAIIEQMLTNEIKARNGVFGYSLQKADFILYGTIAPYHEEEQYYHDYIFLNPKDMSNDAIIYTFNSTLRNSPQQVYIFQLILKNEKIDRALLLQNLLYCSIEDVYDFFPLLIFNVYSQIGSKRTPIKQANAASTGGTDPEDWRNKWLYLRTSFDFPITFYKLREGNGLISGTKVYQGSFSKPDRVQHLDNIVVALPAMTWGLEVQLCNWLSIEPKFQISWEYINSQDFINLAIGSELKFPLKFIRNIMLEPYGSVSYPVFRSLSNVLYSYPLVAFGGGFQLSIKGGQPGAAFIDINYMYYCFGDTVINNPYKDFPKPGLLHYQRSVIGLGIGYKFGAVDRK